MKIPKKTNHHLPDWIFDSGLFYVAITDMEGKYIYVNEYFLKKFQIWDSDFENKYFTETVNPEDIEKAVATASACIQNPEKSFSVNLRKQYGNSQNTTESAWEFSLLRNNTGEHIGIFSIGYELGKKQNLIPDSRKEKTTLNRIFKNGSDGYLLVNSSGEVLNNNKIAEKILGTVIQDDKLDFGDFKENGESEFIFALRNSVDTSKPYIFQDNIGDIFFKGVVIPNDGNFSIIFRENTKEQKSKIKIQESENKLKGILDSTPDCIVLINEDLKILAFNSVASDFCMTAKNQKMYEGDNFLDFVFDSTLEDFHVNFNKALDGNVSKFEKELEIKADQKQWLEFIFCPVFDHDKKLIGVTQLVKDISESKARLAKIEYQNKRLKEIAWRQSHEVRTPLANLMGLVNLLSFDKKSLSEEQIEEFYGNILCEANKLDQIIRKISSATEEELE